MGMLLVSLMAMLLLLWLQPHEAVDNVQKILGGLAVLAALLGGTKLGKSLNKALAGVPPDVWTVIALAEKWGDVGTSNMDLEDFAVTQYLAMHPNANRVKVRQWIRAACAFRKDQLRE